MYDAPFYKKCSPLSFQGFLRKSMVGSATQYTPKKLQNDAVIEVVCQLNFSSSNFPEIIIGKLSEIKSSPEFSLNRLQVANIPYDFRMADPNLQNQPTVELVSKDKSFLIRFSERLISCHVVGPNKYMGWHSFKAELTNVFGALFHEVNVHSINSISLRYINALRLDPHHISDLHDLNFESKVKDITLDCPVNLNFIKEHSATHLTTTRIAHPMFVQGALPEETVAIIDVEASTPINNFQTNGIDAVTDWLEIAHQNAKDAFFKLIPDDVISKLEEK